MLDGAALPHADGHIVNCSLVSYFFTELNPIDKGPREAPETVCCVDLVALDGLKIPRLQHTRQRKEHSRKRSACTIKEKRQ